MNYETARTAMVDCQVRPSDVTKFPIIDAMLWAPREQFVTRTHRNTAYAGDHIQVSDNRHLLDPRIFAKMLDAADLKPEDYVLDIAGSTGYSAAVISKIVSTVVMLENGKDTVSAAGETLSKLGCNNVATLEGDITAGNEKNGPYDVIFVNGALPEVPKAFLSQLSESGRLVCIVESNGTSQCIVVTRNGESFTSRRAFDASAPMLNEFTKSIEFAF